MVAKTKNGDQFRSDHSSSDLRLCFRVRISQKAVYSLIAALLLLIS